LHQDLTTGEVAAARDTLGRIAHGTRTLAGSPSDAVAVQEALRAWFTLLWCFERIQAGRRTIGHSPLIGRSALRFLDEMITSQVRFLNEEAVRTRGELTAALGVTPSDQHSRRAFVSLVEDLVTNGRRDAALAGWDIDHPLPGGESSSGRVDEPS
jgi:hypothetical protein